MADRIFHITTKPRDKSQKTVNSSLPLNHRNKKNQAWRQKLRETTLSDKQKNQKENNHLTEAEIRIGVLNGTIPSSTSDTGSTSRAGLQGDLLIITDENYSKVLYFPNGTTAQPTKVSTLDDKVIEPERTIDMLPD